jgi:NTP pyrophosphatase (non-canonical NTP hydrolase)
MTRASLDDYQDDELAHELDRRAALRAANCCSYCERPNVTCTCRRPHDAAPILTLRAYQLEARRTTTLDRPLRAQLEANHQTALIELLDGYGPDRVTTDAGLSIMRARHLDLAALGLAGESGEVVDVIKKHVHHGKPLDRAKLVDELGDVLWYLAYLASIEGIDLAEVATANSRKSRARFPNGFSFAAANARADEKAGAR